MITFIQAHSAALLAFASGITIATIDLIWAVNPNAKSNGMMHWLFLAAGGKDPTPGA